MTCIPISHNELTDGELMSRNPVTGPFHFTLPAAALLSALVGASPTRPDAHLSADICGFVTLGIDLTLAEPAVERIVTQRDFDGALATRGATDSEYLAAALGMMGGDTSHMLDL